MWREDDKGEIDWYKLIKFEKGDDFKIESEKKHLVDCMINYEKIRGRNVNYGDKSKLVGDFQKGSGEKLLDLLHADDRFPPYLALVESGKKVITKGL